ncbi:MAG TPA: methyltransferase domain-containing protein [Acetobacteraceae bacterium]|nr:methyltransferase domain-containing protein [Acetobacteraceae bacterium]
MAREAAVWDPAQYLRFANERLRPALDLLAQVPLDAPARVVDLGCGAGNVTAILKQRFPEADVAGVDGSAAMLETARATVQGCRFEQADFFRWQPAEPPDLIFSNAALHWVDGHPTLFPRLLSFLAPVGVLAVQMPAMHDTPLRRIPYELAATEPWAEYLSGVTSAPAILSPMEYWDLLRPYVASLELWQTTYMHALRGENAVTEWAAGSSLRPFLDRLPDDRKVAFRLAYSVAARRHYPPRADGNTLLPFHRVFMVARVQAAAAPFNGGSGAPAYVTHG